jgi:hypothetical protein
MKMAGSTCVPLSLATIYEDILLHGLYAESNCYDYTEPMYRIEISYGVNSLIVMLTGEYHTVLPGGKRGDRCFVNTKKHSEY